MSDTLLLMEVHSALCMCRGGSWLVQPGQESGCLGPRGEPPEDAVLLSVAEWQALGRPRTSEAYRVALRYSGERRQSPRFAIALRVRLRREVEPGQWEEDLTVTETLGEGGAMVSTCLCVATGERVELAEVCGMFRTIAEIVNLATGPDGRRQAGMRFLDANVPTRVREILRQKARKGIGMNRKTVLLVDDSRTILMQQQVILGRAYNLLVAHDGREAVTRAVQEKPDLILMDVVMPEMDGLAACRELRQRAETRSTPIILVTTRGEHASRAAGFESGCTDYLTKPINPVDLLSRISENLESLALPLVRPVDQARARVLREYQVVGTADEEAFDSLARLASLVLGTSAASIGFLDRDRFWQKSLIGASRGDEVARAGFPCTLVVESGSPLVIGDITQDARFREHPFLRSQGVRFYASAPLAPPEGVAIGSIAVFDPKAREVRPSDADMLQTLARQVVAQLEIRRTAIRDPLTGVFNRRYMEETLERELRRADRLNVPLGLVLLDVDRFRALNEGLGHTDGDAVLGELGALLQAKTRQDDVVCRYESDAFLVILPSASLDSTRRRAQQLKEAIERLEIHREGRTVRVTASAGVATSAEHGRDAAGLLRVAQSALDAARQAWRSS